MRVGDYYEAFDEDADSLASVLGITKTMRGEHRMAGFPHHSLESYLSKLVKAGVRVAVADPVKEKPDA
jgi:DNA mismatch repair protein MutS